MHAGFIGDDDEIKPQRIERHESLGDEQYLWDDELPQRIDVTK